VLMQQTYEARWGEPIRGQCDASVPE
jgi:hypothetical protein